MGRLSIECLVGRRRQLQVYAAEEFFVVREVCGLQPCVRLGSMRKVLRTLRGRIAAAIVRRRHQKQGRRIGIRHDHIAARDLNMTALVDRAQLRAEFHASWFELIFFLLQLFTA